LASGPQAELVEVLIPRAILDVVEKHVQLGLAKRVETVVGSQS
jgi:hypothetical protein